MSYIWQIGVVVRDLEKTTANMAKVLGVTEIPPANKVGSYFTGKDCGTVYLGEAGSAASCMTVCFAMDNVELEFIQPVGDAPSEWKRFLEEKGEGIHHLAWKIEDVEKSRAEYAALGFREVQCGSWGEGEYHYFDTAKDLGFVTELMKFYS